MRVPDIAGLLARPPRPGNDLAGLVADSTVITTQSAASAEPRVASESSADEGDNRFGGDGSGMLPVSSPAVPVSDQNDFSPEPTRSRRKRRTDPVASLSKSLVGPSAEIESTRPVRQYLRSITIYVPRRVHEALLSEAGQQQTTMTALILQAVNSTHDRIAQILLAEQAAGVGDLFDVPQLKSVREPSVEVKVRVTDRQLAALQGLVDANATSRSKLVTTALLVELGL